MTQRFNRVRRVALRLVSTTAGVASIEFLVLAPVMIGMVFAFVDLGNILYDRFRLGNAVATAATYGIRRYKDVSTDKASDLAKSIATLVGNTTATGWAKTTVTVNNGPVGTNNNGTASATTTDAATTNGNCYCPTSASNFGVSKICGITCDNGAIAGRYIIISARHPYSAVFTNFGIVKDGYISVIQVVQTE